MRTTPTRITPFYKIYLLCSSRKLSKHGDCRSYKSVSDKNAKQMASFPYANKIQKLLPCLRTIDEFDFSHSVDSQTGMCRQHQVTQLTMLFLVEMS